MLQFGEEHLYVTFVYGFSFEKDNKKFVLISTGLTSPHSCWFNKLTIFETIFVYQDQYENSFLLQVIFTEHFHNCPCNAVCFREETSMHFGVQFYVLC